MFLKVDDGYDMIFIRNLSLKNREFSMSSKFAALLNGLFGL